MDGQLRQLVRTRAAYLCEYPQTGDVVRLFHPRRDVWSDHFGYLGQHIVGLTAVGRTTASLLDMNDPERRRVRELVAQIQS